MLGHGIHRSRVVFDKFHAGLDRPHDGNGFQVRLEFVHVVGEILAHSVLPGDPDYSYGVIVQSNYDRPERGFHGALVDD